MQTFLFIAICDFDLDPLHNFEKYEYNLDI